MTEPHCNRRMSYIALTATIALALQSGCSPQGATSSAVPASNAQPSVHAIRDVEAQPTINTKDTSMAPTNKATFGAGCFWGVQARFDQTRGVVKTMVGYSGGHVEEPTYKQVCTDRTGHAEVIEIEYDPSVVTYDELLDVFWASHDPTQVNRQGPDHGTQYRTVIFTHDEAQARTARASKVRLEKSGKFSRPIATIIEPANAFWPAEEYHQKYLVKHGMATCPSGTGH